ncbi:MAG: PAS domain S-box protein [Thermosynechococcaceae cyanobacterium]
MSRSQRHKTKAQLLAELEALQAEMARRQNTTDGLTTAPTVVAMSSADQPQYSIHADAMPVGVFRTDIAGYCLYVNRQWCELTGLSFKDALGTGWLQALPPEDRDRVWVKWSQSVQENRTFHAEYRYLRPDGTIVWVLGHAVAEPKVPGQESGYLGTVLDITERKQADLDLRDISTALSNAVEGISRLDAQGRYVSLNEAYAGMIGYKPEEMIGKPWQPTVHPADQDTLMRAYQTMIDEGKVEVEARGVRKDGSIFYKQLYMVSAYDALRQFDGHYCFMKDVSDRKEAELTLHRQAQSEHLINKINGRIRQSLNLKNILDTAIGEIQTVLAADRVLIYRVWPNGTGSVLNEVVLPDWPSILGLSFPEEVFPKACQSLYRQGRVRTIDDVAAPETNLTPCLREFIEQWGAQALQIVPIFLGEDLWGLLIAHQCRDRRHWTSWETELLQQLAAQLGIAIQQASLFEQVQFELAERKRAEESLHQQVNWQRLTMEMTQRIRQSLDLEDILSTAVAEVRQFLQTDRVVIFRFNPNWNGTVLMESVDPQWTAIESMRIHDPCFAENYVTNFRQGLVTAKADISTAGISDCHYRLLASFQVRANLVAPILQGENLWGLLVAHHCQGPREWQPVEIELIRQLALQLGIAIQQSILFTQLKFELAERQRTEEALRQSEERWQLAIAGSNDGIWDHDLLSHQYFLSGRCLEMTGYRDYEVDNFNVWLSYIHPDDLEGMTRAFEAHLNRQNPRYTAEYRLQCRDGTYKWFLARGQALWDENGRPIRAIGSLADISDRKQAEAEIRALNTTLEQRVFQRTELLIKSNRLLSIEVKERQEAERRWRSLLENVRLVVVGLDCTGKIEFANPFFLEITGYTLEEVLGQDWFNLFIPLEEHPKTLSIFRDLLEKDLYPYVQNYILTKTGEECLIAWNNTLLRNPKGELVGTISIGEDITQRHALERMKDEFISVVSHELRTPLTSIRGSLGLLTTGILNDDPVQMHRMIDIAATDAERLVRLVNDILDLERLESGKMTLLRESCNAATLMQRSREIMEGSAQEADIALVVEPTAVEVWADPDRIIQTLTNLLSNAIKFSPPGSTVYVTATLANGKETQDAASAYVLFQVKDQGRGIPANKLETIFGRFQQVDASDTRTKGGTGLGLAICQTIVQQHGGHIWADSRLGAGSTFNFTLPIATDP